MVVDLIAAMLSLPVLVGSTVLAGPVEPAPIQHSQQWHLFNPHAVIDESQVIDRTRP